LSQFFQIFFIFFQAQTQLSEMVVFEAEAFPPPREHHDEDRPDDEEESSSFTPERPQN